MKVIDKMNQVVNSNANKSQIKSWAYNNRILVSDVYLEHEFGFLEKTVNKFFENPDNQVELDEYRLWDKFLDYSYIE